MNNKVELVLERKTSIAGTVLMDVLAVAIVLLVPALSHLVAYPLHAFEPMRIALFGAILIMPSRKWNAIALAALLPILSFVVSGHPIFPKNIIMSGELVLNTALFYWFVSMTGKFSVSVLLSMLVSKAIYYLAKYLLITTGLLQMELVSTSIGIQLIVMAFFTLSFIHNDIRR